MVQYLFYEQWAALKASANAKGVEFIGDIPIYVSPDSSDLWADPSLFQEMCIRDRSLALFHFLQNALEAFFKRAAVFCAGHQRAQRCV